MTRSASSALLAHLAGDVTTVATCWHIVRQDGEIFGFTDCQSPIVFGGVTYESASGYVPTAVEQSCALNVDNLEVQAILDSSDITEEDMLAGVWNYAKVEIFLVNYEDLTQGKMILKTGTIGEITLKQPSFVAEIRGNTQPYSNNIMEMSSPTCRVKRFGDERCKLSLSSLTVSGTVTSSSPDNRVFGDTSRTEAGAPGAKPITGISQAVQAVISCAGHGLRVGDYATITDVVGVVRVGATDSEGVYHPGDGVSINGSMLAAIEVTADTFTVDLDTRPYDPDPNVGQSNASEVYSAYVSGGGMTPPGNSSAFDYGLVRWITGLNAGLSMEVKEYSPGVVMLQLPMQHPIAAGDQYELEQGCDRSFARCRQLNNTINFRGEPHLPGQDKVMRFAGTEGGGN